LSTYPQSVSRSIRTSIEEAEIAL